MDNKVSIVVPIYNSEQGLSRCIDSILNQSYKNFELLLVNDGSVDNSLKICEDYAQKDNRLRVITIENQGSGPARNIGIKYSRGDFLYFPDSDDIIDSTTIEICLSKIINKKADLLVFGFNEIMESGESRRIVRYSNTTFKGDYIRNNYHLFFGMNTRHCIQGAPWNKFFSAKVIKDNNIEYPALKRHQDEGFICRYVQYTQKVVFINDILYNYYANNQSAVQRKYPINYIDSVMGLNRIRQETILTWNTQNFLVNQMITDEFVCNLIWAFELSFHKKYNLKSRERINWIKWCLERVRKENLDLKLVNKRIYQGVVFSLLYKSPFVACILMKLKILIYKKSL